MATNETPIDYSPEQLKKIYAQARKEFTVEDLIGYIEDDDEKFPAEQVMAEVEEIIRAAESHQTGCS